MKYLKSFTLFETVSQSSLSEEQIVKDVEEIYLDFQDDGMKVDVSRNEAKSRLSFGAKVIGHIVGATKFPDIFTSVKSNRLDLTVSHFENALHHLLSYMKEQNYKIYDFTVYLGASATFLDTPLRVILYQELKPTNKSVESDPMAWLKSYLEQNNRTQNPVYKIEISFMKNK